MISSSSSLELHLDFTGGEKVALRKRQYGIWKPPLSRDVSPGAKRLFAIPLWVLQNTAAYKRRPGSQEPASERFQRKSPGS